MFGNESILYRGNNESYKERKRDKFIDVIRALAFLVLFTSLSLYFVVTTPDIITDYIIVIPILLISISGISLFYEIKKYRAARPFCVKEESIEIPEDGVESISINQVECLNIDFGAGSYKEVLLSFELKASIDGRNKLEIKVKRPELEKIKSAIKQVGIKHKVKGER